MGWADVESVKNNKEKADYTKFSVGNTLIRVLDDEPYSFWQHWLPKQNTSVTCLGKDDCPICEVIRKAKENKLQPQYNSTQRHALRIWNYTTNKMEILIQGKTFMNNLLMLHKEVGDIRTYDIKVIRNGEGINTTYVLMPTAPEEFKIKEGITEIDLAETFKSPTRDEVIALMEGKTWAEINETEESA